MSLSLPATVSESGPQLASPYATHLATTPVFAVDTSQLPLEQAARFGYERAKAFGHAFGLTANDIYELTPKFWAAQADPALMLDGGAVTLFTIHVNLVVGTLTTYLNEPSTSIDEKGREDLQRLVDKLLNFELIGQFCLTELGHGLDAENLETTATLLPSGEFDLNTPVQSAAKYMPPTVPAGRPCVAIVFARLIVSGRNHGVRPFVVPLNDGRKMYPGIVARRLPYRHGADPVNHSLTSFHNVRLPKSALLGGLGPGELERGPTEAARHELFLEVIWRVAVGTLGLSFLATSGIELACTIGLEYSLRRFVVERGAKGQNLVPIYSFRTQQIPLLVGTAQAYVLRAFHRWAAGMFSNKHLDKRIRHGIAACSKAISVQHCQATLTAISERCGAQGLFIVNQMTQAHGTIRGSAIAEGDILGISIRLAMELLLGRYSLPPSSNPNSLLAKHELGLLEEGRAILAAATSSLSSSNSKGHRSEAVNKLILPRCQPLVEAIGHRMAYDAAVAVGEAVVPRCLVDLYEAHVVKLDAAWYCTSAATAVNREALDDMEVRRLDAVLPRLPELVDRMGVKAFVKAPIASQEKWDTLVDSLPVFDSNDRAIKFENEEAFVSARL